MRGAIQRLAKEYGHELSPLPENLDNMMDWFYENEHIFDYNDIYKSKGKEEADKFMNEHMRKQARLNNG